MHGSGQRKGDRMKLDPIYILYRKTPPPRDKAKSVTVIAAYFDGYDCSGRKQIRGSKAWWAYLAGQDNRAAEQKGRIA
jgi:hypothetical protein